MCLAVLCRVKIVLVCLVVAQCPGRVLRALWATLCVKQVLVTWVHLVPRLVMMSWHLGPLRVYVVNLLLQVCPEVIAFSWPTFSILFRYPPYVPVTEVRPVVQRTCSVGLSRRVVETTLRWFAWMVTPVGLECLVTQVMVLERTHLRAPLGKLQTTAKLFLLIFVAETPKRCPGPQGMPLGEQVVGPPLSLVQTWNSEKLFARWGYT